MSRKNDLNARDGKLAINKPSVVAVPKIPGDIKSGKRSVYDKHRGKQSYVEKSIKSGDYKRIAVCIQKYREENPDSTYMEVYSELHNKFAHIFGIPVDKIWASNVSKIINSDKLWSDAYWAVESDILSLAKIRISQELNKDDADPLFALKTYDIIKKHSIEEKKLDLEKKIVDTEIPTFVFKGK